MGVFNYVAKILYVKKSVFKKFMKVYPISIGVVTLSPEPASASEP